MVQGCASGVGKSVVVAGLCRLLHRRGIAAAPFKAVSISLNSGVSVEGGEMARAQMLQAWAAGTAPQVAMNPVLLKPEGAGIAQLVIAGRVRGRITTGADGSRREAWRAIEDAYDDLSQRYDAVIIEGSGSPAEPNLLRRDLANMRVARMARAPVLLVGNIEQGGVFAAFSGTLAWLPPMDRARIAGFIINRHHGPSQSLRAAIRALQTRSRRPVLGVLPYVHGLQLSEEDTLPLRSDGGIDIVVLRLPHLANFTDFEPLRREPAARVRFVDRPEDLGDPAAIILPGTKATMADLGTLRRTGLDRALLAARRAGVVILGICGGFQMLGERLDDPDGVERAGSVAGLGLLRVVTRFGGEKTTRLARGTALLGKGGIPVSGYEIHMGQTRRIAGLAPFARLKTPPPSRLDGAIAAGGGTLGTYLHGIFDEAPFRRWFLQRARRRRRRAIHLTHYREQQDAELNRLALVMEQNLDLPAIWKISGLREAERRVV